MFLPLRDPEVMHAKKKKNTLFYNKILDFKRIGKLQQCFGTCGQVQNDLFVANVNKIKGKCDEMFTN